MFEQIANRQRRTGRRAGAAVVASVVAHVAVGGLLLVATFWHVDKLAADSPRALQLTAAGMPAPRLGSAPPPPPLGGPKKVTKKVTKRRTKALRQPDVSVSVATPADTSGDGSGRSDGAAGGKAGGVAGGTGTDPFGIGVGTGCDPDGAGLGCDPDGDGGRVYVPPKIPPPVKIVSANLMAGRRIAGDPQITPPDSVRLALLRAGTRQIVAVVKMCLSTSGAVTALTMLSSSGYRSYDAKLRREMRTWRYRPYKARGIAVPVCTAVTFVYRMK